MNVSYIITFVPDKINREMLSFTFHPAEKAVYTYHNKAMEETLCSLPV
jgi:hypothetical protein